MVTFKGAFASFSANNLDKAKEFYGNVLGLPVSQTKEGLSVRAPNTDVFIYPKPSHQPATYTVLNFRVQDVEAAVDSLSAKGVRFLQYDGDIKTDAKGIFRGNGPVIAWFTDPAENILSLVESR